MNDKSNAEIIYRAARSMAALPKRTHVAAVLALPLMFASMASAQGSFSQTGSMSSGGPYAYIYATYTRLPNGCVLKAGGGIPEVNSAEIYCPATGTWSQTGPLNDARSQGQAAVSLPNGDVLVVAGHGPGLGTAEVYQPSLNRFIRAGLLITPRYWTSAVALKDGRALVFGGYGPSGVTTSAEIFDPASNSFRATGSMKVDRYVWQRGALLSTGEVLVACGQHSDGRGEQSVELYNPANETFSSTASVPFQVTGCTLTVLNDGRVLLTGSGTGSESKAAIYQRSSGAWTLTAAMPNTRTSDSAALLPTGDVLLAGPNGSLVFNTAAGTWLTVANSPALTPLTQTVPLIDGRVLVAGGTSNQAFLFTGSATPPVLGGSTTGQSRQTVTCQNFDTGKSVVISNATNPWNCTGLVVRAGDRVQQIVSGTVDQGTTSPPQPAPAPAPAPAPTVKLNISVFGNGTVTGANNVNCQRTCSYDLPQDATLVLTANRATTAYFQYWGGYCSGSALTCTIKFANYPAINSFDVSAVFGDRGIATPTQCSQDIPGGAQSTTVYTTDYLLKLRSSFNINESVNVHLQPVDTQHRMRVLWYAPDGLVPEAAAVYPGTGKSYTVGLTPAASSHPKVGGWRAVECVENSKTNLTELVGFVDFAITK